MTRRLRIICFLSVMACFAGTAGISYLGFDLWPPQATMADGRSVPIKSADLQVCIRRRGLAWLGERLWRDKQDESGASIKMRRGGRVRQ
jgi:hypothetical protein